MGESQRDRLRHGVARETVDIKWSEPFPLVTLNSRSANQIRSSHIRRIHTARLCGSVQKTNRVCGRMTRRSYYQYKGNCMYIGGGILGTILVIALIVYLVRRV
jgi:hypothetical protein